MRTILKNDRAIENILAKTPPTRRRLLRAQVRRSVAKGFMNLQEGRRTMNDFNPGSGLEGPEGSMFAYKGKFYLFQYPDDGLLKCRDEKDAETLLDGLKLNIYLLCGEPCKVPPLLELETYDKKTVNSDQEAASFMSEKTGTVITTKDL